MNCVIGCDLGLIVENQYFWTKSIVLNNHLLIGSIKKVYMQLGQYYWDNPS